jgi:hypothetical protein
MTDLQTKTNVVTDMRVEIPFVVNEFKRVQIPPKSHGDEKEFRQMANVQQQTMMERLIDRVKDL